MRHWTIQLAAGLVALLSNTGVLTAADLRIATAVVDITGPPGYPMGGYGARKQANRGVHDPLLAKVLLLKSNDRQFGIVTYDLVLFESSRVAREAREKLGISPSPPNRDPYPLGTNPQRPAVARTGRLVSLHGRQSSPGSA